MTTLLFVLATVTNAYFVTICEMLHSSYPKTFVDESKKPEVQNLISSFKEHVDKRCQVDANFAFWSSYVDLVELLLTFIRATREGNWELHMSTISCMLPWYFAYGKVHYSRYLPIYVKEMKDLEKSHPDTYNHFLMGDFAVQRKSNACFSMTACDQVIVQTQLI